MAFQMPRGLYTNLNYNIDREIEAFKSAIEAHRTTVDVPAPSATSALVEEIVRNHAGAYEIIDDVAGTGPTLKATFST